MHSAIAKTYIWDSVKILAQALAPRIQSSAGPRGRSLDHEADDAHDAARIARMHCPQSRLRKLGGLLRQAARKTAKPIAIP